MKERVATATQRWTDEQGAEAYLLAEGKPLVEAKELLNRHPETLSGKEMAFIRASTRTDASQTGGCPASKGADHNQRGVSGRDPLRGDKLLAVSESNRRSPGRQRSARSGRRLSPCT